MSVLNEGQTKSESSVNWCYSSYLKEINALLIQKCNFKYESSHLSCEFSHSSLRTQLLFTEGFTSSLKNVPFWICHI